MVRQRSLKPGKSCFRDGCGELSGGVTGVEGFRRDSGIGSRLCDGETRVSESRCGDNTWAALRVLFDACFFGAAWVWA